MDSHVGIPDDVIAAGQLIRSLLEKPVLTRSDRDRINMAKLKIAYWACGNENLPASRENLTYVLGPDAKEIMDNYDKALEREKEEREAIPEKKTEVKKRGSGFWENA